MGSQGPVNGNEPLDTVLCCSTMFLTLAKSKVALDMSRVLRYLAWLEHTVPLRSLDICHTQRQKSSTKRLIFIVEKHTLTVYAQHGSIMTLTKLPTSSIGTSPERPTKIGLAGEA